MPIFQIKNNKAKQIAVDSSHFNSEQELHDFFEENLEQLLGLRLLEHKYDTQGFGIPDTLALDEENSPVIIEYKLGQDPGVLVQGLSYFSWLKENKKHFELLARNKIGKNFKINWENPKVILIAQGFDSRTLLAAKEMDNVELVTYTPYGNGIFYLKKEDAGEPSKFLITKKDKTVVHSLNHHLGKTTKEVKEVFYALQEKINLLPGVNELADQITGITYRATKSFAFFKFGKSYIDIQLRDPKYVDPRHLVRDITHFRFGYKGSVKIRSLKDVDYIFGLVKQSYESTL